MEKKKIKRILPRLLAGSEYKCANPNKWCAANLKGLAIAIVVRAEERNVSKVPKRVWFTLWENEHKQAQEYEWRKAERKHRREPHTYNSPGEWTKSSGREIQNWFKKSLFGKKVYWYGLHKLIRNDELKQSPDHNCEWWRRVKNICEDTTGFDPVAEILKISNEYRTKEQPPSAPKPKGRKKVGRPKVKDKEAIKRREIKANWERYRDTIKGANKKKSFCDENGIKVEYLEDSVLRWCRYHPQKGKTHGNNSQ